MEIPIEDEFNFPADIMEQVINGFLDKNPSIYVKPLISTYDEKENSFTTKITIKEIK